MNAGNITQYIQVRTQRWKAGGECHLSNIMKLQAPEIFILNTLCQPVLIFCLVNFQA